MRALVIFVYIPPNLCIHTPESLYTYKPFQFYTFRTLCETFASGSTPAPKPQDRTIMQIKENSETLQHGKFYAKKRAHHPLYIFYIFYQASPHA